MKRVLSWTCWPLVVLSGVCATYLGFRSGYPLPMVFIGVSAALVAVTLLLEQVLPQRADWNALTDRQSLNDLGHAVIENQIGERLGGLVFMTAAAGIAARLTTALGGSAWPSGWPLVAQIGLVVLVADGLDYWKHRLLHTVPGLWRIHALHHGIARLHVFKASRLHFTDVLMRFLFVYSPLAILGAPAELVFWYTTAISIFGVIGHSNVDVRVPSALNRVFMTPAVHRLHHSTRRTLADSNYTNIFPIWDLLFGTFSDPDEHELEEVGVIGDPIPSDFVRQFLAPFIWTRLARTIAASS